MRPVAGGCCASKAGKPEQSQASPPTAMTRLATPGADRPVLLRKKASASLRSRSTAAESAVAWLSLVAAFCARREEGCWLLQHGTVMM